MKRRSRTPLDRRHRTALFFCLMLPFALAPRLGWWTPRLVVLVSYTFFGLDALGDQLEDPFGEDPNDLALDAMVRTIERELLFALGRADLPLPLTSVTMCCGEGGRCINAASPISLQVRNPEPSPMQLARITSKGQMTVPKRIRDAARLATGDVVLFEVDDGRVTFRKLPAGEDAYLRGVQETLSEWNSPEDEDAWRDL